MNRAEMNKQFMSAVEILPERLWKAAYTLSEDERAVCEELRIRAGGDMWARCGEDAIKLTNGDAVTHDELDELISRATNSSIHTYNNQIQNGFLTLKKGHRLGLCGELAPYDGGTIKTFSSCNLRIAKEIQDVALPMICEIYKNGFENTLIVSPPGAGKTTFLRDTIRLLSQKYLTCLADERMEVAACQGGQPRFDVGDCDVISGGNKNRVIEMLTRAMSPQIIAIDEITAQSDVQAITAASYTGCSFIATAHSGAMSDFHKRDVYSQLLGQNIFSCFVFIEKNGFNRKYTVYKSKGGRENAQINRGADDCGILLSNGIFYEWSA